MKMQYALAIALIAAPVSAQETSEPPKEPGVFARNPEKPLTPGQEIASKLPLPPPGSMRPVPDLRPDGLWPSADPRDLQGTWVHNQNLEFRMQRDMYGQRTPFTVEGANVLARRVLANANGAPYINASAICRPPGQTWQLDLNMPFQIFQNDRTLEFVFEEYHGRWQIAFDPKLLPAAPQYMGKSVASWEGNTLVVETSGFKQALWLDVDGTPLSKDGKLVQRIRKVDNGNKKPFLEIVTTIHDPLYYTDPWSVVRTFGWAPDKALFLEYDCEEQVGDPNVSSDGGLVPEPKD